MPDTRITRTATGWTDKDTGDHYSCRRVAREERKARRLGFLTAARDRRSAVMPDSSLSPQPSAVAQRTDTTQMFASTRSFSGLQRRAFNRLTRDFGVAVDEASVVVVSMGYNAAVSYGHLRVAGATKEEALGVIHKGDPKFSLRYGQLRAAGEGHVNAKALASI